MKFNVFLPKKASEEKRPALLFLSGLTCTEDNFVIKSGALKEAAKREIILISPDTSPKGDVQCKNDKDSWDFGEGAGFYVDSTNPDYSHHYKMYSYVCEEFYNLIFMNFPIIPGKLAISGHSMGGHGALVCGLKNPGKFTSISAFAPIANPSKCKWGINAFSKYFQSEKEWAAYDATELVKNIKLSKPILIDQGSEDQFLKEAQLLPENFIAASSHLNVKYSLKDGYDHSYYFISSFIESHFDFHMQYLDE